MNYDKFFAYARRSPFGGRLSQSQKDGATAIIAFCLTINLPLVWIAYILATAFHETGGTFKPIVENLVYTHAETIKDTWPKRFATVAAALPFVKQARKLANFVYGGRNGNTGSDDGWLYRGRGLVQITGKGNYAKFGITNPDDALVLAAAVKILVNGMVNGMFTGMALSHYGQAEGVFNATDARAIVNGTFKASLVASYYDAFLPALKAANVVDTVAATEAPVALLADPAARPDDVSLTSSPLVGILGTALSGGGVFSAIAGITNPWAFGFLALLVVIGAIFGWGYLTGRIHLKHSDAVA
jgi:putative chitinase